MREPYRLFFPLGFVLLWAGVLHWLLHALGLLADYRPVFHSITQVQGFLMCFAVGFLFTAIPRRTGTAGPRPWQLAIGVAAPLGCTWAAWYERWAISQACWLVLVAVLIAFASSRFRSAEATRRPPNAFVWVPVSLVTGVVGSLLLSAYGILGPDYYHWHELGRLLLLQGMFLGLIVGVGSLVLPLLLRGQGPPDGSSGASDRWERGLHLLAAVILVGTFWLESSVSLRGGLALRAGLMFLLLVTSCELWRPPTVPGWHRRLVWLSAWMIPLGYTLAALFPAQKKAGLHVVFIGGFALLALSVALHVSLAHGGDSRVRGRPWQVPVYGALVLVAVALRALVDFDGERFFTWIGLSAAVLLTASLIWATLVAPLWFRIGSR